MMSQKVQFHYSFTGIASSSVAAELEASVAAHCFVDALFLQKDVQKVLGDWSAWSYS